MTKINSLILGVLFIFSFNACQVEPTHNPGIPQFHKSEAGLTVVSNPEKENFDIDQHLRKYEKLKAGILAEKNEIINSYDNSQEQKIVLAQDYLSIILIDSIFPYWVGTPWDFNGHTNDPMVGEVACGYFVSTTIRHLDVKINRYKVAQKASSDIIKELCEPASIKRFKDMNKLEEHLKTAEDNEVLIIGLDYHVGFIYNKEGVSYFAHSNYENLKGVEIVPVENCFALESSNNYVIGSFSGNTVLAKNWLLK